MRAPKRLFSFLVLILAIASLLFTTAVTVHGGPNKRKKTQEEKSKKKKKKKSVKKGRKLGDALSHGMTSKSTKKKKGSTKLLKPKMNYSENSFENRKKKLSLAGFHQNTATTVAPEAPETPVDRELFAGVTNNLATNATQAVVSPPKSD